MTIIFKTLFGSHLYGTNTPSSDRDFKAVRLPSKREILLGTIRANRNENTKTNSAAKNSPDDVDCEVFSLGEYVKLLLESQTMALDMLFAPRNMWIQPSHPVWEELLKNRERFLSKQIRAFVGYALQQAGKYGVKGSRMGAIQTARDAFALLPAHARLGDCGLETIAALVAQDGGNGLIREVPTADCRGGTPMIEICGRKVQLSLTVHDAAAIIERVWEQYGQRSRQAMNNEGVDWKSLSHAVRCVYEAREFLATGAISLPLLPDNLKVVMAIKLGQLPYVEVAELIERGVQAITEASLSSSLPERPDTAFAEEFVMNVHERIVRGEI